MCGELEGFIQQKIKVHPQTGSVPFSVACAPPSRVVKCQRRSLSMESYLVRSLPALLVPQKFLSLG